uniref:C-type lectin domain-containing protein n=1 Tax=Varanus komodoensis TaxID=61221 RepID=A0A8D2KS50_VARKO
MPTQRGSSEAHDKPWVVQVCNPPRWHTFEGSCYYFSEIPKTWQNATQFCTKFEAHLIIINSKQEQDFVVTKMSFSNWLGLTDAQKENEWLWGCTPWASWLFFLSYWRLGEPNNSGSNEDCAALYKGGVWNDIPCDTKSLFICEKRVRP